MRKVLYILIPILFIGLAGLSFYYINRNNENNRDLKDDYLEEIPGIIDDITDYISLDEFNKINVGMTYDEVKAIIGMPGITSSSIEEKGHINQIFSWYGKDRNSSAEFYFTDDVLVSKSETDLK